uniref:Secreted protein n=1 Tax=Cynoglossus semilaevis TaxID=244447 RepID=A0A3P8V9R7_CYNSE
MLFWSFLAGLVTFYCSLGPESLLPNVLFTIKSRTKVPLGFYCRLLISDVSLQQEQEQELFPLGHCCAVCGKVKCKRHRPTLLLENFQPWLDLKLHSKVDASIAEVSPWCN